MYVIHNNILIDKIILIHNELQKKGYIRVQRLKLIFCDFWFPR